MTDRLTALARCLNNSMKKTIELFGLRGLKGSHPEDRPAGILVSRFRQLSMLCFLTRTTFWLLDAWRNESITFKSARNSTLLRFKLRPSKTYPGILTSPSTHLVPNLISIDFCISIIPGRPRRQFGEARR